jgi:TolA-binding protein
MWARTAVHILTALLAAAAGLPLAGCAMADRPGGWLDGLFGRDEPQPAALVEMEDSGAFEEGIALVSQLKYAEAERKFFDVLQWYEAAGDRPRTAETKFWLAFCYEKQGRIPEAKELYSHILRKHRQTPAARQAADRLERLQAPPG